MSAEPLITQVLPSFSINACTPTLPRHSHKTLESSTTIPMLSSLQKDRTTKALCVIYFWPLDAFNERVLGFSAASNSESNFPRCPWKSDQLKGLLFFLLLHVIRIAGQVHEADRMTAHPYQGSGSS